MRDLLGGDKSVTMDSEDYRWITTERDNRVKLDSEGNVLAGFGGEFNGQHISSVQGGNGRNNSNSGDNVPKTSAEDFKKKLDSNDTIGEDYKQAIADRFDQGTDVGQAVYMKYVPDGNVVSCESEEIYAKRDKVWLNEKEDTNNPSDSAVEFFHEQGHVVDHQLGNRFERCRELTNLAQEDFANLRSKMSDAEILNRIGIDSPDCDRLLGVSDIISGLTNREMSPIIGVYHHEIITFALIQFDFSSLLKNYTESIETKGFR